MQKHNSLASKRDPDPLSSSKKRLLKQNSSSPLNMGVLSALKNPINKSLTPPVLAQIQRRYGNQVTLQLLRRNKKPAPAASTLSPISSSSASRLQRVELKKDEMARVILKWQSRGLPASVIDEGVKSAETEEDVETVLKRKLVEHVGKLLKDEESLTKLAEYQVWQLLQALPQEEESLKKELVKVLDARRQSGGRGELTKDELERRRRVFAYLQTLKTARIAVPDAINFGHQAAGVDLMTSLRELGFGGQFQLIVPPTIQDRLNTLLPNAKEKLVIQERAEFEADQTYKKYEGKDDSTVLTLVPAIDTVAKDDPKTVENFLNFLETNQVVILQPYAWGKNHPKPFVAKRTSEGPKTKGLQNPTEVVYERNIPTLGTGALNEQIEKQVQNGEMQKGLKQLFEFVRTRQCDLMTVYGLHRIEAAAGIYTRKVLVHAVRRAANPDKPVIMLMLSRPPLDVIELKEDWLTETDLSKPGEIETWSQKPEKARILMLNGSEIPKEIFEQLAKQSTLPMILEGANTSNLMQLMGKPFMSPRTQDTPFPKEGGKIGETLGAVEGALTTKPGWGDKEVEKIPLTAMVDINTVEKLLRFYINTPENLKGEGRPLIAERLDSLYGNKHHAKPGEAITPLVKILKPEKNVGKLKTENNNEELLDAMRKALGGIPDEKKSIYQQLLEPKIAQLKTRLKPKTEKQEPEKQALEEPNLDSQIRIISEFITQSLKENSEVNQYFQEVQKQATSHTHNQVLHGITELIDLGK